MNDNKRNPRSSSEDNKKGSDSRVSELSDDKEILTLMQGEFLTLINTAVDKAVSAAVSQMTRAVTSDLDTRFTALNTDIMNKLSSTHI